MDPHCSLCIPKEPEAHWVEVHAVGSKPERWRVTVDVTMELCAEHKRRLLQAVGMDDVADSSPPQHPWASDQSSWQPPQRTDWAQS